jgi:hypothetical protein
MNLYLVGNILMSLGYFMIDFYRKKQVLHKVQEENF